MNNCFEKLKPYTALFLRVGLGVIFLYHGWGMVFGAGTSLGSSWNPYGMPAILQVLLSWGQFLGGIALFIGAETACIICLG